MNPIFQWVLLTLAAYRLQRIVTTDSWPPSQWFRDGLVKVYGPQSKWVDFFSCPWCFGFFSTLAVFSIATVFISIPLLLLQCLAVGEIDLDR